MCGFCICVRMSVGEKMEGVLVIDVVGCERMGGKMKKDWSIF